MLRCCVRTGLRLFDRRSANAVFTVRICPVLCALIVGASRVIAAENWPDAVDEYVAQVRRTTDTTDIDGYAAVVRDPAGALLLAARQLKDVGFTNVTAVVMRWEDWRATGHAIIKDELR